MSSNISSLSSLGSSPSIEGPKKTLQSADVNTLGQISQSVASTMNNVQEGISSATEVVKGSIGKTQALIGEEAKFAQQKIGNTYNKIKGACDTFKLCFEVALVIPTAIGQLIGDLLKILCDTIKDVVKEMSPAIQSLSAGLSQLEGVGKSAAAIATMTSPTGAAIKLAANVIKGGGQPEEHIQPQEEIKSQEHIQPQE